MSNTSPAYLIAQGTTAIEISRGSTTADKLSRAKVAASIGAFFTAAGTGNFTEINAQVATAIASIPDAATAQFATNLWSLGQPWLQLQAQAAEWLPTFEQVATDIGAGMSASAGAAITQYSAAAAK
jgi:hypothetical protein